MNLSTPQRGLLALTVFLVAAALWAARGVPEPATPEPVDVEELTAAATPTPTPVPTPDPVPRVAPVSPREVAESAFVAEEDGLAIAILEPGSGPSPEQGDVVQVDYSVWTEDGGFITSTLNRSRSFRMVVGSGALDAGWERALAKLKPGGRLQARIPASLGLGLRGDRGDAPPDAGLVLDLDLVGIQAPRVAPDSPPQADPAAWKDLGESLSAIDLEVGQGIRATEGQTIAFDYTVWLEDGTRVDSTLLRGAPTRAPLGAFRLMRGMERGLLGMQPGGRRLLRVPPALGFGASGRGDQIPPNAELTIELRLVEVQAP